MRSQLGAILLGLLLLTTTACVVQPETTGPEWFLLPLLITVPLAIITAVLGLLVLYYVYLVRAILEMLERDANKVLLGFCFVALIPAPPFILMGIMLMIIWSMHKRPPESA
jgi:hypothetical protein